MEQMDQVLSKLLWGQLRYSGLFTHTRGSITDLTSSHGIHETYTQWLIASLAFLAQAGYLSYNEDRDTYTVLDSTPLDHDALWQEWEQQKIVWQSNPDTRAHIQLVETMLRSLPAILTRKKLATDIMFPHASLQLVEGIYKNNVVADYFNDVLAQTLILALEELLQQDPVAEIRILEIGAGSGGTSTILFKKLQPYQTHIKEYCFTDISKAFLHYAEKTFSPSYPYITYALFNVENPPARQEIKVGNYDIVIAANVLHATHNIKRTVNNAKALLRKNGLLLLNEISNNSLFTHLTFGLLEGWWSYEDPALRIPGCPALAPDTWQQVLDKEGFHSIFFPAAESHALGQQIIVAASDGVLRVVNDQSPAASIPAPKHTEQASSPPAKPQRSKIASTGNALDQMAEEYVKELLLEAVSETLKIERSLIDLDSSFADYGLDSILGVNLAKTISETFQIDFPTTDLFDYSSINLLARHIATTYTEVIVPQGQTSNGRYHTPSPAPSSQIDTSQIVHEHDILQRAADTSSQSLHEPIAIIGMSGRFAHSENVEALWQHLANGDDLVDPIKRWDLSQYYPADATYCNYGSFLDKIDTFDPLFFNISGMEATYMDPQQRIFLEESWRALEDAGYAGTSIGGSQCGVYVGCAAGDYTALFAGDPPPQALWGSLNSAVAARISYYLDLQGPALTVDTACSSSLVAIHLACQSLWSGETEMALAGGIYIQTTPQYYLLANRASMLSPTGHCYTFDDRADGMVPGEAVGVVVLKRLSAALADGDHIHGIIRGSGINQDGTTNGITAPSLKSQERLEQYVYDTFQIDPAEIQMVEAHGTGTKLGDPIEYQAISRAFRHYTEKKAYAAIGSLKTNLGHTQLASGVAGLIKILLSLKHQQIPPSLHFQSGNPAIQFSESPFYVNTHLTPWEIPSGTTRRAAISSFGATGTNAHMVIEEAPAVTWRHRAKPGYLIVLSAQTHEQLRQQAEQLVTFCRREPESDCGNMSYTLFVGRKHFKHRLACVVSKPTELIEVLTAWLEKGKVTQQLLLSEVRENERREQLSLKRYGNQCIQNCLQVQDANEYIEQLTTIADLYVQGYRLEYAQLFTSDSNDINQQYMRLSLPTYPFALERYWVAEHGQESQTTSANRVQTTSFLHPLLQQNTSNLTEQRFSSTFTGYESFLPIYHWQGQRVFPGTTYLEMAQAAVAYSLKDTDAEQTGFYFKQLTWNTPVFLPPDPFTLHISLTPQSADTLLYEIYTDTPASTTDTDLSSYHRGNVILHAPPALPARNLAEIQARCQTQTFSSQEWSEMLTTKGMSIPALTQVIETLAIGPDLVIARLSLSENLLKEWPAISLPPILLEAALQLSTGLQLSSNQPLSPSVLQAVEEATIFSPCRANMWAILQTSQTDPARLDLDLCDENGNILLHLSGITLQTPMTKALALPSVEKTMETPANTATASELLVFGEHWQTTSELPGSPTLQVPRTLLCFLSNPHAQQELATALHAFAPNCTLLFITQGTSFSQPTPYHYTLDPTSPSAYQQALHALHLEHGHIDTIFYLWPLEDSTYRYDPTCLTSLLQALPTPSLSLPTRLLWGTTFANELERVAVEAWISLERSLGIILPQLQLSGIIAPAVSAENIIRWTQWLWQSLQLPRAQSVFYTDDAHPALLRIQPLSLQPNVNSPLRQKGTYLITGGMGGLGQLFAAYLARTYSARLLLIGRSPLDAIKQAAFASLEAAGGKVLYMQADVCNPNSLREALRVGKERFGPLHGVIHAAGLPSHQTFLQKSRDTFQAILAPKIQGTLLLDELLAQEPLDFACYFSSSSAILGDFGAGDYALGNRFLMTYGRLREQWRQQGKRSGKTLVINWPLWREGGMDIGDTEQTQMYLASSGQRFLESSEGLQLFEQLLSQPDLDTQYLVLAGQPARINHFLGLQDKEPVPNLSTTHIVNPGRTGRQAHMKGWRIEQCLEWDLSNLISQMLKLERERIDRSTNLTDFGFDSISLAEFARVLSQYYGLSITPALFFGYPTLERLANYLLTEQREAMNTFYSEHVDNLSAAIPLEKTLSPQTKKLPRQRSKKMRFLAGNTPLPATEPIAIIGMSGRFPQARNIDEFWTILSKGQDAVSAPPAGRFPQHSEATWRGGWVPGVSEFDPAFFGISPREAEFMDPRQRLLLQEAWNALEDAGYGPEQIDHNKIAMFVGVENGDYQFLTGASGANAPITSNHDGILAARLAYFLNLHGPVMSINTACSSGLVATHEACLSLRNQECDTAIAAGVNLILYERTFMAINQAGMLSQDGTCFAFDKRANGMVPGEAVAVVVLKRLSQAIADGDPIYALIKGSGINYDGKTNGITAPNGVAQTALLKSIYDKYQINPEQIEYIVAHGTGTRLGDPIEVNALYDTFKSYTQKQGYCALTSTKTNVGHTFAASGLVSLIALVQALRHNTIPASLHCKEENDFITWEESSFYVNKSARPWLASPTHPRLGAVSAFGVSGTNAHMVIEDYLPEEIHDQQNDTPPFRLLVFSARTEEKLITRMADMLAFMRTSNAQDLDIAALSYTLMTGRQHFSWRCAIVVQDYEDALQVLQQATQKGKHPHLFQGSVARDFAGHQAMYQYIQDATERSHTLTQNSSKYLETLQLLADLYCQGYEIPWKHLYGVRKPVRLHLPTYPFSRENYWVRETPIVIPMAQAPQTSQSSSPQAPQTSQASATPPDSTQAAQRLQPLMPSTSIDPQRITLEPTVAIPAIHNSQLNKPIISLATNTLPETPLSLVRKTEPQPLPTLDREEESQTASALPTLASEEELQHQLLLSLAEALVIDSNELDVDTSFIDLGLDSIIGVEWIQTINKTYQLTLSAPTLYEHPTIRELASYVSHEQVQAGKHIPEIPIQPVAVSHTQPAIQLSSIETEAPRHTHPTSSDASTPIPTPPASTSRTSQAAHLEKLTYLLAEALAMDRAGLDVDTNFIDLGLDSIIGVEWIQTVNKHYNLSLTASVLYDYPNLRAFAAFLEQEQIAPMGSPQITSASSLQELIRQVQQGVLSAEQANQWLQEMSQHSDGNTATTLNSR
ncbi:SDR family NAD(P)-dependent oxidoreductase [Dictyobacter arantiisoli]|uniref:Polyketide synthase n=1 Tax=Dictyobacter arantiisoli TaxID=2014874 RepID=A0A5A5T851_9CHLR|nr:SDR family NAD(P)-dependent oxidoreductase [Dictyobacter arantiisoli]GCF07149.1 hypothetical protein KDI_07130 [Dictyobacter arantiisoli]